YPRGASKWNPVEHRLFSHVSHNWSGEPLTTIGKMLSLIRGTKGVAATASLDRHRYPLKEKVTDAFMAALNIIYHRLCPNWNYTIKPRLFHGSRSVP
ncbi:MAG: ISAzo13 family transposase, partial [Planctomycetota bacterium]